MGLTMGKKEMPEEDEGRVRLAKKKVHLGDVWHVVEIWNK
jgi:hypothetical protein